MVLPPIDMIYEETLAYMYARLPMFSRIGSAAYKKDLHNTLALCKLVGNPQDKLSCIHVGGTNGKGSTTNYIASTFIESGLKVGIYTSPHLIDFRERIKIGSEMISKEFVIDFIANYKQEIENLEPSFFEITVVMALQYFVESKVDIAIIEVGLGGRLDSTNVIHPLLSVITNVSYDHMNMLGDTIEKIAIEKAGIIKRHVPVIIGEYDSVYNNIFESKAKTENSDVFFADKLVSHTIEPDGSLRFQMNEYSILIDKMVAKPNYQIKNIKTSILSFLQANQILKLVERGNLESILKKGIENRTVNTQFLGRWTELHFKGKNFILESAHNEAGIKEFTDTLTNLEVENPLIIFGCVRDKDITCILNLLPKKGNYILTQSSIPRALPVEELHTLFLEKNLTVLASFPSIDHAVKKAMEISKFTDTIFVTGSIFLVGEVLGCINTK